MYQGDYLLYHLFKMSLALVMKRYTNCIVSMLYIINNTHLK